MDKMQALQSFWSQFGWDAYDSLTVPENAILPYLTYEASSDDFDHPVSQVVSLWDRSTSWAGVESMRKDVEAIIGRGGAIQPYDNGAIWIKRGQPFAQRMTDPDDTIRRIVLNIETEFID